jgi:hypothetical protein
MITFEQISEAIKVFGLVAAGFWTAWTFHRLQKTREAELKNKKMIIEAEKARIEAEKIRIESAEGSARFLHQQPVLAIELEVAQDPNFDIDRQRVLCVSVKIKNEGQQDLVMEFNENTLMVGRVDLGCGSELSLKFTEIRRFRAVGFNRAGELEPISRRRFRVGATRRMALAALPATPGVYFVEFRASYRSVPPLQERDEDSGSELLRGAFEQNFFVVPKDAGALLPPSESPDGSTVVRGGAAPAQR